MLNPASSAIKVSNAIIDGNGARQATMYRQPVEHTKSMIASLNYRIRPMNLKRMCYDCRIV